MSTTNRGEFKMSETNALLKLIEIGRQEYKKGNYKPADDFFKEMESDENFSPQIAKGNDLSHKQG